MADRVFFLKASILDEDVPLLIFMLAAKSLRCSVLIRNTVAVFQRLGDARVPLQETSAGHLSMELNPARATNFQAPVDIQGLESESGTDKKSVYLLCEPKRMSVATSAPPRLFHHLQEFLKRTSKIASIRHQIMNVWLRESVGGLLSRK